jgi:hypothetical protein
MFDHLALARCPLLFDTLVTLLICVVGVGLGRRSLRLLRLEIAEPWERGFFALVLGLGALTYLPFALFALGLGTPPILVGALLLLGLALLPEEVRVVRGALRGVTQSLSAWRAHGPAWTWLLVLALAPLLLVTFLRALCPPTDPDGLSYHLTAPLRYLHEGRFVYMPSFLHVHWPLGIEMLFAIGLAFDAHYAAGLIQYCLGLLLLLGTYLFGKRIASAEVGWLSACLLLGGIRGQMTMAYIDLGLSLFTLACVYAFTIGWQTLPAAASVREEWGTAGPSPQDRGRWWLLSALLAGFAATSKLPGVLTIGILTLMTFLMLWGAWTGEPTPGGPTRLAFAWPAAVRTLAVGLLIVIPWFVRCWVLTRDPVYPYFWSLFGARDWDAAAQKRFTVYFQMFNTLRSLNPTPAMVVRIRVVVSLVLALIGIILARWRVLRPITPLVIFVFAFACLQVASSGIYERYFLPVFALAFLLMFWVLRRSLEKTPGVGWGVALVVLFVLWGMHHAPSTVRYNLAAGKEGLKVALGSISRDTFLERLPIYPSLQWANANLPPDATLILGVWDPYAALVERRTLVTNVWVQDALRFDSVPELLGDVERLHATHLLLHFDPPPPPGVVVVGNKEDGPRLRTEFACMQALAAQYGELLYSNDGYRLYALKLPKPVEM